MGARALGPLLFLLGGLPLACPSGGADVSASLPTERAGFGKGLGDEKVGSLGNLGQRGDVPEPSGGSAVGEHALLGFTSHLSLDI